MAKRTKKKDEGAEDKVLRCDLVPSFMNGSKRAAVEAMLRDWRRAACTVAALQWRCLHLEGRFDRNYDPATRHRKEGAAARAIVLRQIGERFGLAPLREVGEANPDERRRLAAMAPGLQDPLSDVKASLGAAQTQMVVGQVMGTLESFMLNRRNDFVSAVFNSSIASDETLRRQLFTVNRAAAWFDLKRPVTVEGAEVPAIVRRLARKIMSSILKRHRRPSMRRIGMVVDQRVAKLEPSGNATSFDLWLGLTVPNVRQTPKGPNRRIDRFERIQIPLRSTKRLRSRKGERKLSFQINQNRESGAITVGVITDVGKAYAESRAAYAAEAREPRALDFGLSVLFASDKGDLLGRNFLTKLKALDATLSGIARHVQRSGRRPRTSSRYREHAARVRGYVRTEIGRVLNRFVAVRKPSALYLERLDFRSPDLSARMNRILQNCGRSAVKAKLQSLKEEFGVETVEVVSAYTSQTCSCCGYVDRRNRSARSEFSCRWCGARSHADVNAARNVCSERFRAVNVAQCNVRKKTLDMLVSRHVERWPLRDERRTRKPGAPADPRLSNPHFAERADKARFLLRAA